MDHSRPRQELAASPEALLLMVFARPLTWSGHAGAVPCPRVCQVSEGRFITAQLVRYLVAGGFIQSETMPSCTITVILGAWTSHNVTI